MMIMKKQLLRTAYFNIAAGILVLLLGVFYIERFGMFFTVTLDLQILAILAYCICLIRCIKRETYQAKVLPASLAIVFLLTILRVISRITMELQNSHLANPFIYLIYFSELFSTAAGLYAFGNGNKIFLSLQKRPSGRPLTALVLILLLVPLIIGLVCGFLISFIQVELELTGGAATILNTHVFMMKYQTSTQQMNGSDK